MEPMGFGLTIRSLAWLGAIAALAGGGVALARYVSHMPGRSWRGPLEALTAEEADSRDRLKEHVYALAGEIGGRWLGRRDSLDAAADYVRSALQDAGYAAAEQSFAIEGKQVRNLEAERRGAGRPEEIIVVGAHYDTAYGNPGANDNASGVAALLELARLSKARSFDRTVRYVAFVNEEPPYFYSSRMGSWKYAERAKERGENIVAMLSLETIGYYSDAPGSQRYPLGLGLWYPDTAGFVAFVGDLRSRALVHRSIEVFRRTTKFPSEGAAAPRWIPGIAWSDHWSFWRAGYPAAMITDTALYRYRHYHTAEDTPEKLDYARMARVVWGIARVVEELASAVGPG